MAAPVPVAVLGASGYSGGELLRLLSGHPSLEVAFLGAHDAAGRTVGEVLAHLAPYGGRVYEPAEALDPGTVAAAFVALPAGMAAALAPDLVEAGVRVVDLSGDFRLGAADYPAWYGYEHPAPAWLDKAVYGLTELARAEVRHAALVANPGCYPTPVILGLAPLLAAGLIEPAGIVVDGKSGISGAGRKPTAAAHFASLDGSVQAYRVGTHQHTPEMERALGASAGAEPTITFVPHLVPAVRGIVTTSYARLAPGAEAGDLHGALAAAHAGEPFVRVLAPGAVPDPKRVAGTNVCELAAAADARTGTAVVIGAIDNLGKGAAGQALQNLNLMLGFDETVALPTVGMWP